MASKFRMLGEPTRLAILRSLMQGGELSVGQIVKDTGRELANVSKHLKHLAAAGLVTRSKRGAFVFYRLSDPILEKICRLVCDSIAADVRKKLGQRAPGKRKS